MQRPPLIIPVEIQSRELDAKLLLSCVAAERGFDVFVGSRRSVNLRINRLPRSIYLAKGVTKPSHKMFDILARLGHMLTSWDEEALVYYSPAYYLHRRVFQPSLEKVSILFAWGDDNARIWQEYSGYHGAPVHVTGNPRVDLLRPELRDIFADEARAIAERHGEFVLINSNFGSVNFFYPEATPLKLQEPKAGAPDTRDEFTAGLAGHRHKLFQSFLALVPQLAAAMPATRFIIRPHPAENHEPWKKAAAGFANVEIVQQGNVVPWLLAARAIVHNGCTTAVEAFILDRPVFSYRPVVSEAYDTRLPNELSEEVYDAAGLVAGLGAALEGRPYSSEEATSRRAAMIGSYVAALSGPLCSDRIVDVLEHAVAGADVLPKRSTLEMLQARVDAAQRALKKWRRARLPNDKNNLTFQRHNFPPLAEQDVAARIGRYRSLLGRFDDVQVRRVAPDLFKITAGA